MFNINDIKCEFPIYYMSINNVVNIYMYLCFGVFRV